MSDKERSQGQESQAVDPVLYVFPGLGPQIQIAREYLYQVAIGKIDPHEVKNPLSLPLSEGGNQADLDAYYKFRVERTDLDGKTALALLREQVQEQLRQEQRQVVEAARQTGQAISPSISEEGQTARSKQPYDRLKYPPPRSKILRRKSGSRAQHEPKPLVHGGDPVLGEFGFGHVLVDRYARNEIPVIGQNTDIRNYPVDTPLVYLTVDVLKNPDRVKKILERFPNLAIVQVAPRTFITREVENLLTGKEIKREGIRDRRKQPDVPTINMPEHIRDYPVDSTTIIHITNQDLLPHLKAIMEYYTHLRVLEVYPSAKVSAEVQKLAAERGIQIIPYRRHQISSYDILTITPKYLADKERFQRIVGHPDLAKDALFMAENEMLEYELAARYYGPERITFRQLAKEFGLSAGVTGKRLQVFNVWAGGETTSQEIKAAAEFLKKRLRDADEALANSAQGDRYRRSFAVGDSLPPLGLPIGKWSEWQQLMTIYQNERHQFDELQVTNPRGYEVVMRMYALSQGSEAEKRADLAREYGVSSEALRVARNRVFVKLRLIPDTKLDEEDESEQ